MPPLDQERRVRSSPEAPGTLFAILSLWPLLLPLALLLPGINAFPYPSEQARYSDLALAHYPYAFYLRQAILQGQGLPTWSPLIMSGAPLAANPLVSMWYPPAWLALIFPLPLGFNLVIMAHMIWGGIGMYLLLRAIEINHRAALLGALAFEAMPKLFAHYGAGHLTLLYAVSWTPWLLWSTTQRQDARIIDWCFNWRSAAILALIFLADVRWTAYAAFLWCGYTLASNHENEHLNARIIWTRLTNLVRQMFIAGLLAAPLGLPLLEYIRLSSRVQMSVEDVLEYSLPASRLMGLLFPDLGGYHEWMLYCGGSVFLLSLVALFWLASMPGARFWAWTAGLSLLYALGSVIPVMPILARFPGFNLLRAPSRALFLACMALAVLAAYAVDNLMRGLSDIQRRRGGLPLVAVCGFTLALVIGVYALSGELALNFLWGSGAILAGGVWIGLRLSGRVPAQAWFIGLLSLCFLDWAFVDRSLFSPRPANLVFAEGGQLARYLYSEKGIFRIYSPSYSLPQQTSANYGLQLADGVDPLQLESYVRYMQTASGVPGSGYQVTIPPFANGDPTSDNASYQPDTKLLGLLNVRFVAADFDLKLDTLVLRNHFGITRLYENNEFMPRAWIQPEDNPPGQDAREVDIVHWTPEHIELHAQGPGLLILSEVAYPGWTVRVDGGPAGLELVAGLLRGVRLGGGKHEVVFSFRPLSMYLGVSLSIIAIIFVIAGSLFGNNKLSPCAGLLRKLVVSKESPDTPAEATKL